MEKFAVDGDSSSGSDSDRDGSEIDQDDDDDILNFFEDPNFSVFPEEEASEEDLGPEPPQPGPETCKIDEPNADLDLEGDEQDLDLEGDDGLDMPELEPPKTPALVVNLEVEDPLPQPERSPKRLKRSPAAAGNDAASEVSPSASTGFNPKVNTEGHRTVCRILLPVLLEVLCESSWRDREDRAQVREACARLRERNEHFWGANEVYSRKRTAEAVALEVYYKDVKAQASAKLAHAVSS